MAQCTNFDGSNTKKEIVVLRVQADIRPMTRVTLSEICLCCVSDGIPRRSFLVALIVGTILNLINQGDALLGGGHLNVAKLVLTFAVPYCVATYGAVSYRLSAWRSSRQRELSNDKPTATLNP
jgi:hypothetical protein